MLSSTAKIFLALSRLEAGASSTGAGRNGAAPQLEPRSPSHPFPCPGRHRRRSSAEAREVTKIQPSP
jgi:hypothetical protein